MKLRIRGNSIRLRLTRSEIERFVKTGVVGETVEFGSPWPVFNYELNRSSTDDLIKARFEHNCLSISIPVGEAENWIRTEEIGLEVMHPIGDNKFLRILVEKDFACLNPRANEDESDTFAHPLNEGTCA
ncbi:MAG: DUF7009 family protein [Pyrinomonadaceae bacterium]